MTAEQFLLLQEGLLENFGWIARWWMIMFAVSSVGLGAFMFFLQVVSTWLETRS